MQSADLFRVVGLVHHGERKHQPSLDKPIVHLLPPWGSHLDVPKP